MGFSGIQEFCNHDCGIDSFDGGSAHGGEFSRGGIRSQALACQRWVDLGVKHVVGKLVGRTQIAPGMFEGISQCGICPACAGGCKPEKRPGFAPRNPNTVCPRVEVNIPGELLLSLGIAHFAERPHQDG